MFWLLVLCAMSGHVVAAPNAHVGERIVGGELTTIDRYPFQAALLHGTNNIFSQSCGGSILNPRSILSAASCLRSNLNPHYHRIRVGSTFANSGGVVHGSSQFIVHPNFDPTWLYDSDVVIVRSSAVINFNSFVQPASIAGANYNLLDNEPVWATGWGLTSHGGSPSEQLRHVQIWTINQDVCRSSYSDGIITDNVLCAGVPDVVGNGQCFVDFGGPLHTHNGVVVGITSILVACSAPHGLGVNTRVSSFSTWIQANA